MQKRRWILFVMLACVVGVALIAGLLLKRDDARFIDYTSEAVWSKDSKSLFYARLNQWSRLYRYDTRTGRTRSYRVKLELGFDVSPDERAIVQAQQNIFREIGDVDHLRVINIMTGHSTSIYSSKKEIGKAYWLPQGRILFSEETKTYQVLGRHSNVPTNTYLIDLKDRRKVIVARGVSPAAVASDGSGFIYGRYNSDHPKWYYFSLATRSHTFLGKTVQREVQIPTAFIYVSNHIIIYELRGSRYNREKRLLDLSTMQTRTLPQLKTEFQSGISPDLKQFWTVTMQIETFHPYSLHLLNIPEEVDQLLARY